jgi:cytochrome bd-type quinol oxidase subunit 2
MRSIRLLTATLLAVLIVTIPKIIADAANFVPGTQPTNLPAGGDLGVLLTRVINYFIGLAGLIAVVMLVLGGYRYLSSGGNEEQVTKAKHTILYAIVALTVLAISFSLIYTITRTLRSFDDPGTSISSPGSQQPPGTFTPGIPPNKPGPGIQIPLGG